jgi:hypothetical protein
MVAWLLCDGSRLFSTFLVVANVQVCCTTFYQWVVNVNGTVILQKQRGPVRHQEYRSAQTYTQQSAGNGRSTMTKGRDGM